jgi:hypothetical protein
MKRSVAWALAWTAFVVAFILLVPGDVNSVGCWRLVGAPPECLAQLAALNDHQWWTRTLPMLVFLSSGYLVIGAAMARSWIRTRRHPG